MTRVSLGHKISLSIHHLRGEKLKGATKDSYNGLRLKTDHFVFEKHKELYRLQFKCLDNCGIEGKQFGKFSILKCGMVNPNEKTIQRNCFFEEISYDLPFLISSQSFSISSLRSKLNSQLSK